VKGGGEFPGHGTNREKKKTRFVAGKRRRLRTWEGIWGGAPLTGKKERRDLQKSPRLCRRKEDAEKRPTGKESHFPFCQDVRKEEKKNQKTQGFLARKGGDLLSRKGGGEQKKNLCGKKWGPEKGLQRVESAEEKGARFGLTKGGNVSAEDRIGKKSSTTRERGEGEATTSSGGFNPV